MKKTLAWLLALPLAWLAACGSPADPSGVGISEISVVHVSRSSYGVVFRADGTATRSCIARGDGSYDVTGRIEAADFRALASLVEAEGFFGLQRVYGNGSVFSGSRTSVVREGLRREVRSDGLAAPPQLLRIQDAIDQAGNAIPCGVSPRPHTRSIRSWPFM